MSEITNMYEKMGIRPEVLKFGNTIDTIWLSKVFIL